MMFESDRDLIRNSISKNLIEPFFIVSYRAMKSWWIASHEICFLSWSHPIKAQGISLWRIDSQHLVPNPKIIEKPHNQLQNLTLKLYRSSTISYNLSIVEFVKNTDPTRSLFTEMVYRISKWNYYKNVSVFSLWYMKVPIEKFSIVKLW